MTKPDRAGGRKTSNPGGCSLEETAWISKILHDEVGQVLSAAGLRLELLRMDFEGRVPEIAARTLAIQELLDRALMSVRKVVSHVNPAPLKGPGAGKRKPK